MMFTKKNSYAWAALVVFIILLWLFFTPKQEEENVPKRVKIALREVGNQLLLAHQDSTSIVLPVIEISPWLYELSFERPLSITPNDIVGIVKTNFKKAAIAALIGTIFPYKFRTTYCFSLMFSFLKRYTRYSKRLFFLLLLNGVI